jgi:uncharacterized integral membrane protein (TIGR00698 family)
VTTANGEGSDPAVERRGSEAANTGTRFGSAQIVWGLALAGGVAALATAVAAGARSAVRSAPDAVVLSILLGLLVGSLWRPGSRFTPGLAFAERRILEIAIVLLGASTDLRWIARAGPLVAGAVVAAVVAALVAGVVVGRRVGLTNNHALLVAAGNAICGNSAIAAVAAVIGAKQEESASAITLTAIMSLGLVLLLPAAAVTMSLSHEQFGVLAGLTVYSVPQVLAATFPVSARAGEVGTLIKLIRVLLLIPLLMFVARQHRGVRAGAVVPGGVFPPYIQLFLLVALLRTTGLMPDLAIQPAQAASHALTVVAMAALGLSVEVRRLREVGWRTAAAAGASLVVLSMIALGVALFGTSY